MKTENTNISVVTGGAHGIGKAIALKLLAEGDIVTVWDINRDYLDALKRETANPNLHVAVCDVGTADDVTRAMIEIEKRYGKIDRLVNNAGIGRFESIDEMTVETWNRILSVNLGSVFYTAKFGKHLFTEGSAIVNIASTRALMSEPNGEAYGASKGGIVALTHALAVSLGPKTRVNCISPGWIEVNRYDKLTSADHAQHPCGRVGTPEDIAELAVFLLSEKAGFITGQNFTADGGMTKKMIYAE